MDKQSLTRLFAYHYWANKQLWSSIMALSEQQFVQVPSDGSPSIRTQVIRMVSNENLWVNYLWHDEVEFLRDCHVPTRASIRQEWDALQEEICDFITVLSPADLDSQVHAPFLNQEIAPCVWEILLNIIQQSAESRAQLCLHLRRLGSPAVSRDFFDFLAEQRQVAADHM